MPPRAKRPRDANAGEVEARQAKRVPSSSSSAPLSAETAERLSWQAPSQTQVEEEHIDLTQTDDGPARELYGSLGEFMVSFLGLGLVLMQARWEDCWCQILQWFRYRRGDGGD